MSDNIKVVVKVRPLISREIEEKLPLQWKVNSNTLYQIDSNGRESGQTFTFDKVYDKFSNTSEVYNDVAKPIVEAATAGFNGTIFAYGQTSSGKTYTMTGTKDSPGIMPLAILNLFDIISGTPNKDFLVRVSYIEIYNDTLKDLLDIKRDNIKIHETLEGNIKVDVTEKVTATPDEVLDAMKEGDANRQTGATNMNDKSSRSHSIFQITVESREHVEGEQQAGCVNVAQLNLVDLAGSERADQTGATGQRFREGTHINRSLFSLTLVIKQLSEDRSRHANYRDSKLTRILQNSLGGNALTSIICAITPAALEETISTLKFATRAKTVKNKPEVNAVATDATMIQELTRELAKLQAELHSKKNLELMLENKMQVEVDLQKRIQHLQHVIIRGLSGARGRAARPARRVTISALPDHPPPDARPITQRFRTPALKYNPALIPAPSDFAPIPAGRLASLPEEPRPVTPPLRDKNIDYGNEIIELDSDDELDETKSLPTCSPYHKCRDTTKTPPCILRKNTREAEKNLKDIMKLTEREKIYTPSVVELIEKLEKNTNETTKLHDEIESLKTESKQKDEELSSLKGVIATTEAAMNRLITQKSELEAQCKKFNTKVTEWEVIYETLQKKAKLREVELLSLLEEQKHKHAQDISKVPFNSDKEIINFMDMSKDLSLVNSDNESSVINTEDDDLSLQTQEMITGLQTQIANKDTIIHDLETEIQNQKERIDNMQKSNQDIQQIVSNCKEEISHLQNENSLLRSSIDTLNSTVKCQKENLESAQSNLDSCYSVIRELEIKLKSESNTVINTEFSETLLETMIANEEKAIANNDNIKNIIYSLKLTVDNRKREEEELKEKLRIGNETGDRLEKELTEKTLEIETINADLSKTRAQLNENITTIHQLMQEKTQLANIEQTLIEKIKEIELNNLNLEKNNKDSLEHIDNMTRSYEQLKVQFAEKIEKETSDMKLIEDLEKSINVMSAKIVDLEKKIKNKDELLLNLSKETEDSYKNLEKAKQAVNKIQDLFQILTGNVQEVPNIIDDLVSVFNILSDSLSALEEIALTTVSEKDSANKNVAELKNKINDLTNKHIEELSKIQNEIESVNKIVEEYKDKNNNLLNDKMQLENNILILNSKYENLEHEFKNKCDEIKTTVERYDREIAIKEQEINILINKLDKIENDLMESSKSAEDLNDRVKEKQQSDENLVKNCVEKLENVMEILGIENGLSSDDQKENSYDNVFHKMDKIMKEMEKLKIEHEYNIKRILYLENQNVELSKTIKEIDNENIDLRALVEQYKNDTKCLNDNLLSSKDLLLQLKEELQVKTNEIIEIEERAKEWKNQFTNLDILMKQQLQDLQHNNEILKNKLAENKKNTSLQIDILNNSDMKDVEKIKQSIEKVNTNETVSPASLLTICCNTIIEAIDLKSDDSNAVSSCSSNTDFVEKTVTDKCTMCKAMTTELEAYQQKNAKLLTMVENLEKVNNDLIVEQENIKQEIQQLVEPAQELQKKILSHKTNLSILTATTYAENKSLKSQVKGLQHHHVRFHNVCQRDIPEVKKQLCELMTILKGDPSFSDSIHFTQKRYSLPNVMNNENMSKVMNETTLDGDMLMLDTNITLTTADNTLVGWDQTCLDLTQTFTEATDNNLNRTETNTQTNYPDILDSDNQKMVKKLEILSDENRKLKFMLEKCPAVDAICSPIKLKESDCDNCNRIETDNTRVEHLTQRLTELGVEKEEIEKKYNNLVLEMPSVDTLISKINTLEKDCQNKENEVSKLKTNLENKIKEIQVLQEENDSLSSQVMDNISEAEELNKELERLKQENMQLIEKYQGLEMKPQEAVVQLKVETNSPKSKDSPKPHSRLNRSLSDSETSSRMNKISTLQSELHAGREDCKVLTEDVATIKQHLDCSNMSMDLDESMSDLSVFSLAQEFLQSPQNKKCNMPDIQEEIPLDIYKLDKIECHKFYLEKTGLQEENCKGEVKIIEIMKLLYDNLVAKQSDKIENLNNKLRDYEESHIKLKSEINEMTEKFTHLTEELEIKSTLLSSITEFQTHLQKCLTLVSDEINRNEIEKVIDYLKENFLIALDQNLKISSLEVFEKVFNILGKTLKETQNNCTDLQNKFDAMTDEISKTNDNLVQMKNSLLEKENELTLLQAQKAKMHEISNAVTLDIIRKEQETNELIRQSYQRLLELDMVDSNEDIKLTDVSSSNINILIDKVISTHQLRDKRDDLSLELEQLKTSLNEKETKLLELQKDNENLRDINNNMISKLNERDQKLVALTALHETLNKDHEDKIKENKINLKTIHTLTDEISILKSVISSKEETIVQLSERDSNTNELVETIKNLKENIQQLKSVNNMIIMEKESCLSDLAKSCETIKQNNVDMEQMTSDILVLRESMKEATQIIDQLKTEAQSLSKVNVELTASLDEKTRACSRLETNIKTHEKTAQIQSRMIMRLQKQKEQDDISINDNQSKMKELSDKHAALIQAHEDVKTSLNTLQEEMKQLKSAKESLEVQVSELLDAGGRRSWAAGRRSGSRRSSQDNKNIEAVFEARQRSDDLFMDVDFDTSGRSTPFALTKGRDSLLSRKDQSDTESDPPSRPSSVVAARRRRQSTHDAHRTVGAHPDDLFSKAIAETDDGNSETANSEIKNLKEQLTNCRQELEELKERYKDLDEECETCSEYLRERDEQCLRLKKEKQALEQQLSELKLLKAPSRATLADVSVNTDEDWSNLHSVVVDRMSYDAEVEKNKRLTKTIEELRFKKQELKNTLGRMQAVIDKHANRDYARELESTKEQLRSCRKELEELRARCKELDEECETCGEYLREKDEQYRRMKEAKAALEVKLKELQESHSLSLSHSVRKKRQTIHDMNRQTVGEPSDAATETSDDLLTYQVERDDSRLRTEDLQHLKMMVDTLSKEKATLEHQLQAISAANPMFVATGSAIVQGQQITDVMKENQRLKKMNANLIKICKKRGKNYTNRENVDPCEQSVN